MANKPNNPSLWSKAKSLAKSKFDVYPSAYANGWAAKYYKSKGGTWRKGEKGMMMEQGGMTPANKAAMKLAKDMKGKVVGSDRMLKHGGMHSKPKMQGGGSYITTKAGRVGRTYGTTGPYESMDTTGYSKGKKEFTLQSSRAGSKPTTTKIKREEVPSKIQEFKKGATRTLNFAKGGYKSKLKQAYINKLNKSK